MHRFLNPRQLVTPVCLIAAVFFVSNAMTGTSLADEQIQKNDKKPSENKKGEVLSLFDGKKLGHWKRADFTGDARVLVRDGMLVMERGEPLNGVVWAGPPIPQSNYELTYEAQRIDGEDFFATMTFPVGKKSCSLVLGGWGGGLTGISSLDGSDASENETTGYIEFKNKQWYKVRIQVTDEKIRCWVDDNLIVDVEFADRVIDIRIEMVFCQPFGIATYYSTGAVRNLELKTLDVKK